MIREKFCNLKSVISRAIIFMALAMNTFTANAQKPQTVPQEPKSGPVWITLGTLGGPIPNALRSQPANAFVYRDMVFLVDAGDGAAEQLAKAGIGLQSVHTVFLSHLHLDHTAGLGAIIGLRWMTSGTGTLAIYGPKGTKRLVDGILASMGPAFDIGFGFSNAPPLSHQKIEVVELSGGEIINFVGITVRTVENSHFSFDQSGGNMAPSKSLSFRFDTAERSIAYTGDTGPSDMVAQLAKNVDLLVSEMIDVTSTLAIIKSNNPAIPDAVMEGLDDHLREHHLSPEQAGQLASQANAKKLVLTHISAGRDMNKKTEVYELGARKRFPGFVSVAEDLDRF